MSADAPSATKEVQAKFGPVVQLQRSNVSLRQMRMQRSSSKGTITHVEIPFGSVSLGSKPLRKSSAPTLLDISTNEMANIVGGIWANTLLQDPGG